MNIFAFLVLAAGITSGVGAQTEDPISVAREAAKLAGGAYFCNADPEDVGAFIAWAQGRIAVLARDKSDAILARLELKNLLTAQRAKEPEDGCITHMSAFNRALADAR